MIITKDCEYCGASFGASSTEIKRGNGKYCSHRCSGKASSKARHSQKKYNVSCATCQAPLYRSKSKQKASKSGLFFCNRTCRNEAQRFHSDIDFRPSHYKNGKWVKYRSILPDADEMNCPYCNRLLPMCCIDVHHLDENRSNNHPDNLMICCPTCHRLKHNDLLESY